MDRSSYRTVVLALLCFFDKCFGNTMFGMIRLLSGAMMWYR